MQPIVSAANFCHVARRRKPCAEFQRLQIASQCKFGTAYARGKTSIVFNTRARSRLSARSQSVENQRVQPFGCGVNGCPQSSRPAANNDRVEHLLWNRSAEPEKIREHRQTQVLHKYLA